MSKIQSVALKNDHVHVRWMIFLMTFLSVITAIALITPAMAAATPEQQILQLINQQRQLNHLKPLTLYPTLVKLGQEQAGLMASTKTLSHEVNGLDLVTRTDRAGYPYSNIGENIALAMTPAQVVDMWMHSPPHRANILNPEFTEVGIGFKTMPGNNYYAAVFGARL